MLLYRIISNVRENIGEKVWINLRIKICLMIVCFVLRRIKLKEEKSEKIRILIKELLNLLELKSIGIIEL